MGKLDLQYQQALRRDSFPFDPLRLTNWHGAIVKSLCAGERHSAPIESLADRSLRTLGIVARKNRRRFLVKQIVRAIKQLCKQGVLFESAPGRVKLLHGVDSDRVQRLIAKQPITWAEEPLDSNETEDASDTNEDDEQDGDAIDDEDLVEPTGITRLPPLAAPVSAAASAALDVDRPEKVATNGHLDADESAALDILLGPERLLDARAPAPGPSTRPGLSHQAPGLSPLVIMRDHLLALSGDLHLQIAGRFANGRAGLCDVNVELRRDGVLRARVAFAREHLDDVLSCQAIQWYAAPIGQDDEGHTGIYRSWPAGTQPQRVAEVVLADLTFIDDATGR